MPIRAFWLMSGNIRRIQAGDDIRSVTNQAVSQSSDSIREYRDSLVLKIGTVVTEPHTAVMAVERDEQGFSELRMMAQAM